MSDKEWTEWTPLMDERARRGECPECGEPDLLERGEHKVEDAGSGFNGEYTVHWWRGTITCPACSAEIPYADSN